MKTNKNHLFLEPDGGGKVVKGDRGDRSDRGLTGLAGVVEVTGVIWGRCGIFWGELFLGVIWGYSRVMF